MSENLLIEEAAEYKPAPGSLEDRVAQRRSQLESVTTHKFDPPGFDGVFQVELQLIGAKRQYNLGKKHEAVRDEYQKGLRTAADLLLAATVGFHMIVDDEGTTQEAEGTTWKRLAKAYDKHLGDDVLEAPGGGRKALLRLLGEDGVFGLATDYANWCRTRGVEVDRDLEGFS